MQRLCARCHLAISLPDEGTLCFCTHCGAPQVELSPDLIERISSDRDRFAEREAAAVASPDTGAIPPGEVDWRGAIQCAALAGGIALLLSLLSLAFGPSVLLLLFWGMGAPVVTLGLYASRFGTAAIRPGFAARLGLLTGAAVLFGSFFVNIVTMLLQRFAFHRAGEFDALFTARIQAAQATTLQQSGASAAPFVALLNIPEFRAGMMLAGFAVFASAYLLFSAAGGAFAGLLRARRPAVG